MEDTTKLGIAVALIICLFISLVVSFAVYSASEDKDKMIGFGVAWVAMLVAVVAGGVTWASGRWPAWAYGASA